MSCINCGKTPIDALVELNYKFALLSDLTSQIDEAGSFALSSKAVAGLYCFLQDAEEVTSAVLLYDKEVSK